MRIALAPVLLALGCGRIGFDPIGDLLPAGSLQASPNLDGREREIDVDASLDEGTAIARIVIRRVPGARAPATCGDGVIIFDEDDPPEVGTLARRLVDTIDDPWNRLHSYRMCVIGLDASTATAIAEGIAYNNPGPGCLQPPCDTRGSTSSASTFIRGGSLSTAATMTTNAGGDVLLGDMDGDGHLDAVLAIAGTGIDVWQRGDGTGAFGAAQPLEPSATDTQGAVIGDFNNDNRRDIAAVHADAPGTLYLSNASGGYDVVTIDPIVYPEAYDIDAADLDRDGDLDLVVGRFAAPDLLYLGTGTGSFGPPVPLLPNATTTRTCVNCVKLADVNGDTLVDVLLAYNGDPVEQVLLLPGNGDGTFAPPLSIHGPLSPIALAAPIDVDHDGDLDLVASVGGSGGTFLAIASAPGSFTPFDSVQGGLGERSYGLAVADVTGDSHPDILESEENGQPLRLLSGTGTGTFAAAVELDSGMLWSASNIELGDIDEDGRLDIALGVIGGPSQVFLAR